ncbi:aldo/keto reductase [Anaeromyxobacter sp. Fw109-5]|uniref:aldo/keto reductase n=1 Tax=Anaeromyxobacter sp. (strain Fw109-5) TaxID=404589 RepID=UPI0000ED8229|nr:aldo/keto reductase [Anaeromyxobacter sp. Fw109-5]ABS25959.1 aldo/keto reductase [Anaeromyxobacter sp. Fw109-5]
MSPERVAPAPVLRLAVGTAAIGRPAYITPGRAEDLAGARSPEGLRARAHAILDAAWEAGIRWIDAARSYGDAEAFVRSWLDARGRAPGEVIVSSKWGYRYVGGWRLDAERHEVKDHSLAALEAQLAESRALLGPHLALYQLHSATLETGVLEDAAVLDALARLRDGGVRVGVTVSGAEQPEVVRRALAVTRGGAPLFASVQATWNLLERGCEDALREAHAAGRTVMVKEALANGRLAARGDAARSGPLGEVARARGATPDAVALSAALAQPFADVVLLGPATVAQLRSNLAAASLALAPDELATLAPLVEPSEAYWRRRARLAWT